MANLETTYIYSLSCPTTGQVRYVGKADNVNYRFASHISETKNTHKCRWINSLKKKGLLPSIEIIDEVSVAEWKFWERHYISLYKSWGFRLTNATMGGDGCNLIGGHSAEAKAKIKLKRASQVITEEAKRKLSIAGKGRVVSAETRIKIGLIHKGLKMSLEHKKKLLAINLGKKHSAESRKRMSEASKKRSISFETRQKMIASRIKNHKYSATSLEVKKKISDSLNAYHKNKLKQNS